jgi:hypothetical protein
VWQRHEFVLAPAHTRHATSSRQHLVVRVQLKDRNHQNRCVPEGSPRRNLGKGNSQRHQCSAAATHSNCNRRFAAYHVSWDPRKSRCGFHPIIAPGSGSLFDRFVRPKIRIIVGVIYVRLFNQLTCSIFSIMMGVVSVWIFLYLWLYFLVNV